ncbi:MAG: DUF349 domain-containing protein [Paludibacteraceae bacterium]|nr:DUF349 domain-containing protein [Paludibacteraceae bacterium]
MEKVELMEQLKGLLGNDVNEIKEQVEELKSQFYRIYRQEQEAARAKAAEMQEDMAEYKPVVDEIEQNFRELLQIYKTQRAEAAAKREAELKDNLLRKEHILELMKALAESDTADVAANLQQMRELQSEWKTIGQVPAPEVANLQKQYAQYQEQFYDLVKINNELREYDFKKNLEQKMALIAEAEALSDKNDIVEANRVLQKLHEEWAEIGPVARELREEIWAKFKEASTVINKRHQEYFDQLHAKEQENLEKKEALVAQMRDLDLEALTNNKQWDEATEKVQALQAEWRTIGFAPKKNNQIIYEEFRSYTNRFFEAKTAFYKGLRDELSENLRKKKQLVEKAEALKTSTDWRETSDKFIELQKKWKEVGPVARKYSDDVWKQFTAACDYFFEQKKAARKADHEAYLQRQAEREKQPKKEFVLTDDRRKLVRMYEAIQAETKTMENNIGFFSGKASSLLKGMKTKIEANKKRMAEIEAKIAELDAAE